MVSVSLAAAELGESGTLPELPTEPALRGAVALLTRLAKARAFLDAYVLPLLKEAEGAEEWYVAHCREGQDGSYSLQVFVWPPGTSTRIHDHSSWGAYRCAVGAVLEERYERLDDGSRFEYARLKKVWQLPWSAEDGVSTVLPGAGGIHRVGNPGAETAITVHLYGPRLGEADGHDYDPSRHYVCDRGVI